MSNPLRNNTAPGPQQSSAHGGQFANKIQDAPAAGIPARFRLTPESEPLTMSKAMDLPHWPRHIPYPETLVSHDDYSGEVFTEMRVGNGSWIRFNTEKYEQDCYTPDLHDGDDYGFDVDKDDEYEAALTWGSMAQRRAAALVVACSDEIMPSIELPEWDGPGAPPAASMVFAEHSGAKPVVDVKFGDAEHSFEVSYDPSDEEITLDNEFFEGDYGIDTNDKQAMAKVEAWGIEVHARYRDALVNNPEHLKNIGAFAGNA